MACVCLPLCSVCLIVCITFLFLPTWIVSEDLPAYVPLCASTQVSTLLPPDPNILCGSTRVSREQAHASAWMFAPYIHFHPLEPSSLADPEDFLSRAHVFSSNHSDLGPATEDNLLNLISFYGQDIASTFYLSQNGSQSGTEDLEIYEGSGYDDSNGHSNARIFYNLIQGNGTWIYNYYFFYEWNGCSSQDLYYQDEGSQDRLLSFYQCNLGAHEGDWEHVAVEVCRDLTHVTRLSYSQHGWNEQPICYNVTNYWSRENQYNTQFKNMSAGNLTYYVQGNTSYAFTDTQYNGSVADSHECNFFENTSHPIVYSAYSSHASYPRMADSYIYLQETNIPIIAYLKAASLVDRAVPDGFNNTNGTSYYRFNSKVFVPTPDNVVSLYDDVTNLNVSWILNEKKKRVAIYKDMREWVYSSWVVFPGRWGWSYFDTLRPVLSPVCFFENQTMTGECENEQLLKLASDLIQLVSDAGIPGVNVVSDELENILAISGPFGPTNHGSFYQWESVILSPYASSKGNIPPVCAEIGNVTFQSSPFPQREAQPGSAIYAVIIIGSVAGFIAIVLIGIAMWGRYDHRVTRRYKDDSATDSSSSCSLGTSLTIGRCRLLSHDIARSIPALNVSASMLVISGFILTWTGMTDVFDLLNSFLPSQQTYWIEYQRIMEVSTPLTLVLDMCSLISSVFTTGKTFDLICRNQRWSRCPKITFYWYQSIMIVCLIVLTLICTLIACFGAVLFTLYAFTLLICNNVDKLVKGVCIDFSSLGIDSIYCGSDFESFCNRWRRIDIRLILVGALLLNLGQILYLIANSINLARYRIYLHQTDDDSTHKSNTHVRQDIPPAPPVAASHDPTPRTSMQSQYSSHKQEKEHHDKTVTNHNHHHIKSESGIGAPYYPDSEEGENPKDDHDINHFDDNSIHNI